MNITQAYLFQRCTNSYDITMVWESADIQDYSDDDAYRFIGCVDYDTEAHKIVV